jgi:hypothetical protein
VFSGVLKEKKHYRVKILIKESKKYRETDLETFEDALLDLRILDLEDTPRKLDYDGEKISFLFSGKGYFANILRADGLPQSGPFEIMIEDDGTEEPIGFARGTKSGQIISFNMIHIDEDRRGEGIGTDIYENLLERGYIIKSDKQITDGAYSIYSNLAEHGGYIPLIFDDGRVGVKKT